MSSSWVDKGKVPQDVVAIFHASFHPTKGNTLDWFQKASEDLNLDSVEFSVLPSGLHLVDQDVVYFTKDAYQGVCVFRRRVTTEHGHRGFRLSSMGILLAKSARPRPWRHVAPLKELVSMMYSSIENRGSLEPTEDDWEPAKAFYANRQVQTADLGGAGDWNGWSHELDGPGAEGPAINPTLHLPHLLRILGPSVLTLYKHVLGRRRILIYTLPPVEAACILCQVAADMCYENQVDYESSPPMDGGSSNARGKLKAKCNEGIKVLGMVTLQDWDRMAEEGKNGRGWIACTTDALFLEKPSCYDLVVDLTTSTPLKASRPTLSISRPIAQSSPRGPTHRLSVIRFTWSDVKLWNELDRILQRDECIDHECCIPSDGNTKSKYVSTWTDAWRVYEDVCIICAGLWMGSWRGNSPMSYSTGNGSMTNWGQVRLEGDDDLTIDGGYVRNLGMGIEGRPVEYGLGAGVASGSTTKSMRRSSAMSWASGKATAVEANSRQASSSSAFELAASAGPACEDEDARRDRQVLMTLALLQTFHATTRFQLSRLSTLLQTRAESSSSRSGPGAASVILTPKDVLSFELGPLSSLDARYLEWLGEEYGGGTSVTVRRGWKDLFSMLFGFS
ncbi:hypothetical protein PLICRDRAFT_38890 [Plicaturopsis crispa FD-325 SS-3]|nr:hypothetical protein PLICRDRAFT_38890 [Plicaturopsis crispa FD-325 SS-3]